MDASRIRLVPSRILWVFVFLLLFAIAGVAAITLIVPDCGCSNVPRTNPLPGLLASLCLPALLIAWSRIAYREANQDGLRWRTLFRTRFAAWEDVDDYYLTTLSGDSKVVRRGVVKTTHGDFTIDPDWFGNVEGLRAMVEERAVNARARSWERHGMRRDIDWPQEHGYSITDNRVMSVVFPLVSIIFAVFWFASMSPKIPRRFDDPGFGWTIAELLILSVMPLMMFSGLFFVWLLARQSGLRRNERVVVSVDGLMLEKPGTTVRIAWQAVERFYIDSPHTPCAPAWPLYVVESDGARIEFLQSVHNFAVLAEIVVREAVGARQDGWLNNDARRENLDRRATELMVDAQGRRTRKFHYRTRTNRGAIGYGAALGGTIALALLLGSLINSDRGVFPLMLFVTFTGILFWTIWRFKTAGIVTTNHGITELKPFGKRTLSWESITSCRTVGEAGMAEIVILTAKSGNRLRFWRSICDVAELEREIRRRAPQTKRESGGQQDAIGR